jgi:hypothetical protein
MTSATMSEPKTTKGKKNEGKQVPSLPNQKDLLGAVEKTDDAVDFLQMNCMELKLEITWLTTSRQIEGVLASKMLNSVNATKRAVSLSKKLFSSSHPAVKAATAAKQAIISYRDSMTIPVAAIPASAMSSQKTNEKTGLMMKEPGARMILSNMIDEFTTQLDVLVGNLHAAVKMMDEQLESIKARDKQELQDLYNEDDYPESVSEFVQVRGPFFSEVKYTADFEKLAPKTCQRAMTQLRAKLAGTADLAAADFAKALMQVTETIANQLGKRVRLKPPSTHPDKHLRDAEVVGVRNHLTDEAIPDGMLLVEVRYEGKLRKKDPQHELPEWASEVSIPPAKVTETKGRGKDAKAGHSTTETLILSEEEYAALKPYETEEQKKVSVSTLENLQGKIDAFKNIGSMLGAHGAPIKKAVDELDELIRSGGRNNGEVLNEMRNSQTFRKSLHDSMLTVSTGLAEHIETFSVKVKRRSVRMTPKKTADA